jgi:hypothetical protein
MAKFVGYDISGSYHMFTAIIEKLRTIKKPNLL